MPDSIVVLRDNCAVAVLQPQIGIVRSPAAFAAKFDSDCLPGGQCNFNVVAVCTVRKRAKKIIADVHGIRRRCGAGRVQAFGVAVYWGSVAVDLYETDAGHLAPGLKRLQGHCLPTSGQPGHVDIKRIVRSGVKRTRTAAPIASDQLVSNLIVGEYWHLR